LRTYAANRKLLHNQPHLPLTNESTMPNIHFSDTPSSVLVTGATGFIGQLMVAALLADAHQVTVLSRDPQKAKRLFGERVTLITAMDQLPVDTRIDVIINLAGARILGWRWTEKRKDVLRSSRIALTTKLVEWMKRAEHKPKLLLSASAIGYYGIQAQGDQTELSESSPSQAIFMSQLCQEWEAAASSAQGVGVNVMKMRFGLVLGHQGALPMMLLPIKLGMGGALGSGRQWLSWIHVNDLLRGIAHVWQHHANDTGSDTAYNFTAPQAVSQLAFSQTAASMLHRPCILPTPALPMRVMLGEQADLLLEGQRVVPAALLSSGFTFDYPDLRSALADILA
jgi:uncharacterized protein